MDKDIVNGTFLGGIDLLSEIRGAIKATASQASQQPSNEFPVHALPNQVQEIIFACSEHLNYPMDFTAAGMLYAISLAIGNTHVVNVQPAWTERAVLYIACVGRAGTNKSHPISFALKPLVDKDKESYREYEKAKVEYDASMQTSKADREKAGAHEPVKPVYKKLLVSDITPEALAKVHKDNPRGIGLHADELAAWFKNFNRYSKGSEQEQWLSNWSGQPINIDRKSGEPILIADPFISVLGTIQPSVLDEMAKDGRGQNGFIDRILFALPPDLKAQHWSHTEINHEFVERWRNIVSRLLEIPQTFDDWGHIAPRVLKFTREAWEILKTWQHERTDFVNAAEDDQSSSIHAKMQTYAIRLSLILQMLHYSCGEDNPYSIGVEAVKGALSLVGYFQATAEKVYSIVSDNNPLEHLPANKKRVYVSLPQKFKTGAGKAIAVNMGLPERNFERMLSDKALFKRVEQGTYEKVA